MLKLTAEYVRSILRYNRNTGILTWKPREKGSHFNPKLIGKAAGVKHHTGYIYIKISGRLYEAHRIGWFIVKGHWPKELLDHKNNKKADNRFKNLREATRNQNAKNRVKLAPSTSKYKGVSFNTKTGKWISTIMVDGKSNFLGLFNSDVKAHSVYIKASKEMHREFGNIGR